MALTKPLSVPVLAGVREDLSRHLAPVGTLTTAKNVRFPFQGEAQARPGTGALSIATSAAITYAATVGSAGPDYLERVPGGFVFGAKGFGYRYDFGQGRVHVAGSYGNALPVKRLTSMAREELVVTVDTRTPYPLSQAVANGYVAVLYSISNGGGVDPEDNGWFVQVFTEGGTLVASFDQFAIGNATEGYVVADGSNANSFVVLKKDGTDLSAAVITLAATGATIGAFSSVATLSNAGAYWASCYWPGIGWALACQTGATTMMVKRHAGLAQINFTTFAIGSALCPVSVHANATYVYVGWRETVGPYDAKARVYDASLTLTSGGAVTILAEAVGTFLTPPLFGSHISGDAKAFAVVGYTGGAGTYGTKMRAVTLTATGTLVTAGTDGDVYGLLPVTMPFNNGMIWCRREMGNGIPSIRNMLVDYQLDRLGTSYLKNPKVALVTEEIVNLQSSNFQGGWYQSHLGKPVQLSDLTWVAGLPRVVRLESIPGFSSGLVLAEWLIFQTEARRSVTNLGRDVLIPGDPVTAGTLWGTGIDSTTAPQHYGADLGFYSAPTISALVASNSTGLLFPSTTYQYRAVVERIDPNGNRFRSAPSAVNSVTTGASDDTVTVTVLYPLEQLRSHGRGSSAADLPTTSRNVVHIYRTAAESAGVAGQQFQRVTPPQGVPFPTNGTFSWVDTVLDAILATREFIYTDGGVFDNNHPASCQIARLTEDRVWLGGLWDSNQIQSSKILVPGEPPQFSDSPAYRVVLPDDNTGIAAQDGTLVAFCASSIFAVLGSGPTDQGQGAWDSPRVITRSTGCINPLSILESSIGTFFESSRGVELLPRGMGEPQFIGEPIFSSFNVTLSAVTGCAVVTSDNERTARFCNGTTQVFVFDFDSMAWSIDEYPAIVTGICDTDNGAVLALAEPTAGGFGFLIESAGDLTDMTGDVPVQVSSTLEWAGIHPFTIAGWGRFNNAVGMFDRLAPGYSAQNCSLFVSVDNATDVGATFLMTDLAQPDYRAHIPAQANGTAVRLKMTTAGGGWRFMGWTLDIDDHGGSRRMASTERG